MGQVEQIFRPTGTGNTPRTQNAKLREHPSAYDFAAVGEDSNDDTAELQAAIDAAVATGGMRRLELPPGTFKLSDDLVLYSDFELVGHASGKSILKGATGWVANTPIVNVDGLSRVRIRNVGFAFAAANNSTPQLRFNNSTDCLVEDCRFDANGAWNVYIGGSSTRVVVSRIIAEGTCQQHNVEINGSSYCSVFDSTLKSATGNGVEIYHAGADTSTRGNQVCRNYIYNATSCGVGLFGDLETIVSDNVIVSSHNPGIFLAASEVTPAVVPTACTIIGNTLLGCGVALATNGISLGTGKGVTVSGNVLRGSGNNGIYVGGDSHVISANTVYLSQLNGIYVANGSHTFTGNAILDNSTSGSGIADGIVFANGCTNNLVVSNRIADTRTPKLQRYGVLLSSSANTNRIAHNELSNNLTGNYSDTGTGNVIVDGGGILMTGTISTTGNIIAPTGTVSAKTPSPEAAIQAGLSANAAMPANTYLWVEGGKNIRIGSSDANTGYGSYFKPSFTTAAQLMIGTRDSGTDTDAIKLLSGTATFLNTMTVAAITGSGTWTTTGSFGVGTTSFADNIASVTAKCRINAGTTVFGFVDNSGNGWISASNGTITGFVGHINTTDGFVVGAYTNHQVSFRSNNVNRIQISTGGVVGIGTTAGTVSNATLDARITNSTVAALPAAGATTKGRILFVTDGRKAGEGSGAGTGVIAFDDGTAWRAVDTGTTVAA